QAEDGIRDFHVTGVTCALPISVITSREQLHALQVGGLGNLGERHRLWAAEPGDVSAGEDHIALVDVQQSPGHRRHPLTNLLARRSEERRVGKEWKARRSPAQAK